MWVFARLRIAGMMMLGACDRHEHVTTVSFDRRYGTCIAFIIAVVMEEILFRFWENLMSRPAGPLHLRFIFQPIVAGVLAVRSGLRDAREKRRPFLLSLILSDGNRRGLLLEAWGDIGKLFIMACILDTIFQVIALRWFYPLEMLAVAITLAIVPYVIVRSLTNRIAKMLGI